VVAPALPGDAIVSAGTAPGTPRHREPPRLGLAKQKPLHGGHHAGAKQREIRRAGCL